MDFSEKIDIVIQGPYTDYTDYVAECYLEIPFINNVIISCWENDKTPIQKRRVKFVRSKYPISPGTDNKNMQIVSFYIHLLHLKSFHLINSDIFYHEDMVV
jgi:hypothetical protein